MSTQYYNLLVSISEKLLFVIGKLWFEWQKRSSRNVFTMRICVIHYWELQTDALKFIGATINISKSYIPRIDNRYARTHDRRCRYHRAPLTIPLIVTFCSKMQQLLSWLDTSFIVNISNEIMLTYHRQRWLFTLNTPITMFNRYRYTRFRLINFVMNITYLIYYSLMQQTWAVFILS